MLGKQSADTYMAFLMEIKEKKQNEKTIYSFRCNNALYNLWNGMTCILNMLIYFFFTPKSN